MIDLLRTRRSIRKYAPDPIENKMIDVLVEALLRSPTSRNGKSWEFIVVDDRELLAKLSKARRAGITSAAGRTLGARSVCRRYKTDVWVEDCSIAAILVQVTAHDLGLGSCWIQIRNRDHTEKMSAEQYMQSLLGLPKHIKVECMVSIGYPNETKKPVPDSDLEYHKVKHNHFIQNYRTEPEAKKTN